MYRHRIIPVLPGLRLDSKVVGLQLVSWATVYLFAVEPFNPDNRIKPDYDPRPWFYIYKERAENAWGAFNYRFIK